MRIAVISAASPFRGGIARFADALSAELMQRDHSVDVFTFSRQYPALLFPGRTQFDADADTRAQASQRTIDSLNPITWYKTANKILALDPDLVVVNYWMPFFAPAFGTIIRQINKKSSARVVVVCHNIIPHEKRPGDKTLTSFALSKADRFIVMSNTVMDDLQEIVPGAHAVYTPHPVYDTYGDAVDRSEAKRQLGFEDTRLLLFFGLIRQYKGLDTLIDALPKVLKSVECRLVVAGEFYDDEDRYRSLIRSNKIEGNVTVQSGFVPNDKVPEYFCASDVVVLPYKSATQSGIVQIAAHFDRSCIVTDTGGLSEMVLDNQTGFVVPSEDPSALAEAIIRFFEDDCQAKFEREIAARKSDLSWSKFASVLEQLVD